MTTNNTPERPHPRAPRRKRVVLANRSGAREVQRTVIDLEDQNSMSEAVVHSLVRAQLRAALLLAAVAALVLGALPVLLRFVPALSEVRPFGVPLPWLVLGVFPFPFILLIGYLGTRWAERNEREFTELVRR